jgi:hypothetical protein
MPDLTFEVEGVDVPPFAAAPQLDFRLRVVNDNADETIHSVALRCQLQLAATRRHYGPRDQERLLDLFGEPERWSQTLRNMLWTHTSVIIPPFNDLTIVTMPVPCTYDFNVAATKYFYALEEGDVPLLLLFSGTIFYAAESGALQVAQISWEREATFRLPVQVWKQMMETYYPNSAWLPVRKDVFERLYQFKRRNGLPTWEQALERLLPAVEKEVAP